MKIRQNLLIFAAAVGMLASSRADIIYQGQAFGLTVDTIPGQVIEAPFAFLPLTLTLLTGDQAYSTSPTSYGSLQLVTGYPILFGSGAYDASTSYWSSNTSLPYGTTIDSNTAYEPADQAVSGYYGWRVSSGGNTYYGWAQLNTSNNTVTAIAVNTTPNEGIQIGAVPEPTTLVFLLFGASVMFLMVRRNRCQDAS